MEETTGKTDSRIDVLDCLARSTDGVKFRGAARSVTLPTANGQVQIRPGHAEAFIVMATGQLVFESDGQPDRSLAVDGGTLLVKDNRVTVLI